MFILNTSDIYDMEQSAKNIFGLTEEILMENAGIAVYNYIINIAKKNHKIAILAGPGNNGGDGFVTARHLICSGLEVDIFYDKNSIHSNVTKTNFNILEKMGATILPFDNIITLNNYNIIIDALFGIGLKRKINDIYENIINLANNSKGLLVSIDIPSGVYADSGFVENVAIKADYTITFSCFKYCLCIYPAKKYAGKIKLANITIPKHHVQKYSKNILINKNNRPAFNVREEDANKGAFGRVITIGGSENLVGAIKITSFSALKAGCGLLTLMYPNELNRNFVSDIPEIMVKAFDYNKPEMVCEYVNKYASSCTLGNGMGQEEYIKNFIITLVKNIQKPLIIDADGINALNLKTLINIENKIIITPHLKEFSRLVNIGIEEIIKNKVEIAKEFAHKYNLILVLKSADILIALPSKHTYILNKGNTALAKGGSGDALTGLIASFIAQGYSMDISCILACYTLGKAAKYAVKKNHPASLLITDIIRYYSKVFNE